MDKITKEQEEINEINTVDPMVVDPCDLVIRVCYPEDFFDVIEQCKKCKKWR